MSGSLIADAEMLAATLSMRELRMGEYEDAVNTILAVTSKARQLEAQIECMKRDRFVKHGE